VPVAKVDAVEVVASVAKVEPVSLETSPSVPASTDRKANPVRKPLISNFR
jgi:hypothetical protein